VVGYLPDYEYSSTLIQKLNWSALSQVNYFSVTANPTTGRINTGNTADFHVSRLDATVSAAHAHHVKVSLVVGGAGSTARFRRSPPAAPSGQPLPTALRRSPRHITSTASTSIGSRSIRLRPR